MTLDSSRCSNSLVVFRRSRYVLTVVVLLALTAGCVAFPSRDLAGDDRTLPPMPDRKLSIALVIAGTAVDSGEAEGPMGRRDLEQLIEEVVTAYQGSGLFSAVKPGLDDADLRAEVQFSKRIEYPSGLWGLLVLLSAGLIPTPHPTEHYAMTTTFRSRTAAELSKIHLESKVASWIGWVFLPVSPFYFPSSVQREARQQLVSATLLAARDVLERSAAAPTRDEPGDLEDPDADLSDRDD